MFCPIRARWAAAIVLASVVGLPAGAQEAQQLPTVDVVGESAKSSPAVKEKYQLPQTSEGISAERLRETVNAIDPEDALKYMPSLFLRKRNYGDNQAVLATRTTGLGASARSLVYADDILLSALIHNNNSIGAPRWALVSPEQIERVDFLYGPFSAAYPGNSIGGVVQITTRMPTRAEATVKQTEAFQTYDFYQTKKTFRTDQTSATFGNRWNDLAIFVSANYQRSDSQPIGWVTTTGVPVGTTGTIPAVSRTGAPANVIGAGLLHTDQVSLNTRLAYDFTSNIRGTYSVGYWSNNQRATPQTYLRDGAGNQTYGGVSGFASNNYNWDEQHLAQSLSLKNDSGGTFDWDLSVSRYDYLQDIQRLPFTVGTGTNFSQNGKIARLDGTNWTNGDAKAVWRPNGAFKSHEVSFGGHIDTYVLNNPTYATATWDSGPDTSSSLYSAGRGKTQTMAIWAQDAWRFAPMFKLTLGGRLENWRAFDGYVLNTVQNASGAITSKNESYQRGLSASPFSPKASLAFEPDKNWLATASIGVVNRFPTVGELYQTSTAAGQVVLPSPNLTPEHGVSSELALERRFVDGKIRFSLFEEDLRDALISQPTTVPNSTTIFTFVTNVDQTRNRGAEVSWQKDNMLIPHLELFGSVTYVDSRILSDPGFVSATGTTAVGKRVPNIPMWRVTNGATYRPTEAWAFTVASRYSSKQYSTLDNTDTYSNVYQAFDSFFVVDTRVSYKLGKQAWMEFGVDNLNNEKYHLFHPFPQRTYVVGGRVTF